MILFQNEITPVSRHKGPAVTWLRHTAMSRDMAVLWNTGMAGTGVWLGAAGGCYDTNRHVTCHVTQCVDNR